MVRNSNTRSIEPSVPRGRRRELERRLGILRAAARVFRRNGFAATGMRDIAREADLSPGNLYYYFSSKQDLLYFCQDHSLDRLLEACRRSRRDANGADPAHRLGRILRAHLVCILDELDGAAAHLEVDALRAEQRSQIVRKRDRYERSIRRLVQEGMRRGDFTPRNATLVTRAILGALNWTARWYDPNGPTTRDEIAEQFSDYLVKGLSS